MKCMFQSCWFYSRPQAVIRRPSASFALTRLPSQLVSQPIPQALFSLLAVLSERKYDKVYIRAENVYNTLQKPVVPEYDLASVAGSLVRSFVGGSYCSIDVPSHWLIFPLFPDRDIQKENSRAFVEGLHFDPSFSRSIIPWIDSRTNTGRSVLP